MMELKISRKLDFIKEQLLELQEIYEEMNSKDFSQKEKKRFFLLLKRLNEEIIETAIKINQLLLKEKKHFPKSYKYSFLDLEKYEMKISNIEQLAKTTQFRNELAHEYIDMSQHYALEQTKQLLKYYPNYIYEIEKIIER